jgi:CBS domain-containing protein
VVPEKKRLSKIQELVREMKVSEAMTRDVVTVEPGTPMCQLGEILRTRRISGAPVVEDGKVMGIVSIEDFINWLGEGSREVSIGEKMTRDVTVARSEEPLIHHHEQPRYRRAPEEVGSRLPRRRSTALHGRVALR